MKLFKYTFAIVGYSLLALFLYVGITNL